MEVTLLGFSHRIEVTLHRSPIFTGSKLLYVKLRGKLLIQGPLALLEAALEAALRPTAALACLRRRPPRFCRLAILPSRRLPGLSSGPRGLCLSPEVCARERCCSPCTHFVFPAFSRVCTCHPTDVSVCHIRAVPCHLKPSFCLP